MSAPLETPTAAAGDPQTATTPTPITAPALGAQPQAPAAKPEPADKPLGEAGIKALQAERAAVKALQDELAALAPLKELAAKLGAVPTSAEPSDVDKLTARVEAAEKAAKDERDSRLRFEVATAKGLTPVQAARLVGETVEELAADADALFPAAAAGTAGRQADFGGGHRGSDIAPADIHAQIAAAETAGDFKTSIRLKSQMLLQQQK